MHCMWGFQSYEQNSDIRQSKLDIHITHELQILLNDENMPDTDALDCFAYSVQ